MAWRPMPTPPLVNPLIESGFWIHARYAADAADGTIARQLLFSHAADGSVAARSLVDVDGRRDAAHLERLLAELGLLSGLGQRRGRSDLAHLLSKHLLAFDALSGRLAAWLFAGGAEGVPETDLRLDLDPGSDFELSRLTLELAENHGLGFLRSWSSGPESLLTLPEEGSGMPLMGRFDHQVERFMMGLARDLDDRRRLRP